VTTRRIVLAARPDGRVKLTDFRFEEVLLPAIAPGQVELRVDYLSLDPYMRGRMDDRKSYAPSTAIGAVMPGESVCTIVSSAHDEYRAGAIVLAFTGWQSAAVANAADLRKLDPHRTHVTTSLGVLGMPGFTAYAGLHAIGKPKARETVVVAAASGPVGSLVGQLAKIAGARAVGVAGGAQKCAYVQDELRFDAAVDHRAPNFPERLAAACSDGIDVYFESVGGAVWQAVLPLLNPFARVPICGLVAQYNEATAERRDDSLALTVREVLSKSLTLRGFINYEFTSQYYAAFQRDVSAAIADGRVRYREDVVEGLDAAPAAFIGMLDGQNFGKVVVKVSR